MYWLNYEPEISVSALFTYLAVVAGSSESYLPARLHLVWDALTVAANSLIAGSYCLSSRSHGLQTIFCVLALERATHTLLLSDESLGCGEYDGALFTLEV